MSYGSVGPEGRASVWRSRVRQITMLLARVVGTVVSSRKEPRIEGLKLLVCKALDLDGKETGAYVVAADAVQAGIDDVVMFATGSSARQTKATENRPIDAVVMAIVDTWEVGGVEKYRKDELPEAAAVSWRHMGYAPAAR